MCKFAFDPMGKKLDEFNPLFVVRNVPRSWHSEDFGFWQRTVGVVWFRQSIIQSIVCTSGSQEAEDTRGSLTTLVVTKDGNSVKQEEHPQAEHQDEQWDSGFPGGGP